MPDTADPDLLAVLDALPTPVFSFDPGGRHTFVNAAGCRALGRARGEIVGRTMAEVGLPPHLGAEFAETVRRVAETCLPHTHQVTVPTPAGDAVMEVRLTCPAGSGGGAGKVVGIATDVTARVAAEAALREGEARHRDVVESAFDAIITADESGRAVGWNKGAERVFGYTAAEAVGRDLAFLMPARYAAAHTAALAAFHPDRPSRVRGRVLELEGVRKTGEEFPIELTLTHSAAGRGRLFTAIIRDVTERKRAEEALRQSEARLRQVIEDQTEVVCRFRADGTFAFVNDVYCRVFGKRPEDLLGRTWEPIVHPDDVPLVEGRLAEMSPANPVVRVENRVCDAAGRVRWMEFVNRGFYSPAGELVEVQAVGRDVTDRRQAEEARRALEADLRATEQQQRYERQMLQSQKLESLGVLAGGVAHDFNNLLTAVLGYASLTRMHLDPDDPAAANLERIEAASQRAAELCQQMLAYAGRGQFVVAPVDLNALTQEMASLLATVVSKKAVLKFNLTPGLPAVRADATQIRQVVMNLITNASDAIDPTSGVITLTTGLIDADARYLADLQASDAPPPGRFVYLEVSDTGCGMADDVRARMFDPFFTTKFTGRGLGLAAVLGIARAHKGAVKVCSQVGKGTTFKVLFPAAGGPEPAPPPAAAPPRPTGRGRAVLVADDEEDIRVFARKVLEYVGFVVTLAADGQAAADAAAARPDGFALVLLDLTMPRLGGADAFRLMRQHRPDVRVILTSGFAAQEATSEFEGKGLAGFLRKPFRVEDLLAAVFAAVGP